MNQRQSDVITALHRVYGKDNISVITTMDEEDTFIHVMALDKHGDVLLSIEIQAEQDPNRIDVGDRVAFRDKNNLRHGLIVVYRDLNESIGIVPDGSNELIWEFVESVEVLRTDYGN